MKNDFLLLDKNKNKNFPIIGNFVFFSEWLKFKKKKIWKIEIFAFIIKFLSKIDRNHFSKLGNFMIKNFFVK